MFMKSDNQVQQRRYDDVRSYNEALPEGDWREVYISDCPLGCKIYERAEDGLRIKAHNSNYGCKR